MTQCLLCAGITTLPKLHVSSTCHDLSDMRISDDCKDDTVMNKMIYRHMHDVADFFFKMLQLKMIRMTSSQQCHTHITLFYPNFAIVG